MAQSLPHFDALIIAGGRATRLGGTNKAALQLHGQTFLDLALNGLGQASTIAVVGPAPTLRDTAETSARTTATTSDPLAPPILFAQESPPFSGPASAIGAGFAALSRYYAEQNTGQGGTQTQIASTQIAQQSHHNLHTPNPYIVCVPVDTPYASSMLAPLLHALEHGEKALELALCVDPQDQPQWLTFAAKSEALARAVHDFGDLTGASVRKLLATLKGQLVPISETSTHAAWRDIDTPEDAELLGALPPKTQA